MTTEEFLALPENPLVDRALINGELREYPTTPPVEIPMALRGKVQSRILIRLGYLLTDWQVRTGNTRGQFLGGEVGVILRRDSEITVGVDLAYVDRETVLRESSDKTLIDGAPILAIEITSPSDTQEGIEEKVELYLACGVAVVWVVEPRFRTVTVYRADVEPVLFNSRQEINAEPELPGFSCPVAALFE